MTAHVIALASVAPAQRDYERFCQLRRAAAMAFADWIAGPDAPDECDVQAEVFGTCSVFIQTVEMVRPHAPVAVPPPSPFVQGEDHGDVCDAPASGGSDAGRN